MSPALQAFLAGIVDYASLFPPAQLPLEQALRLYSRYRAGPLAWMLGRFVCPAARLAEIGPLGKELFQGLAPVRFSALGRGGKDTQEFFANVKSDLADIARFCATFGDRVAVDAYEVRLPPSAFGPIKANQLSSLIATTAYLIESAGPPVLGPFFEAPVTDRSALLAVIQALHDDHHSSEARRRRRCQLPGFKLRTGGLEAASFPSTEQVALVLAACRAARVPFKATAGLHHPVRHWDATVRASMHGFLNVFAAGCLAWAHSLSESKLQEIVADEDPSHFVLENEGLRWQDVAASVVAIREARQHFITSFGSCSFEEPLEDLRKMKWLA